MAGEGGRRSYVRPLRVVLQLGGLAGNGVHELPRLLECLELELALDAVVLQREVPAAAAGLEEGGQRGLDHGAVGVGGDLDGGDGGHCAVVVVQIWES